MSKDEGDIQEVAGTREYYQRSKKVMEKLARTIAPFTPQEEARVLAAQKKTHTTGATFPMLRGDCGEFGALCPSLFQFGMSACHGAEYHDEEGRVVGRRPPCQFSPKAGKDFRNVRMPFSSGRYVSHGLRR